MNYSDLYLIFREFILTTIITAIVFIISVPQIAFADSEADCINKILDTKKIEGIYTGNNCEDQCYSGIKLDNGGDFNFLCDEDDANRVFKKTGNRVSATLVYEQYWNPFTNSCDKEYVFKSGRIIPGKDNTKININTVKYKYKESNYTGELEISKMNGSNMFKVKINTANNESLSVCSFDGICEKISNGFICSDKEITIEELKDEGAPLDANLKIVFTNSDIINVETNYPSGFYCGKSSTLAGEYEYIKK